MDGVIVDTEFAYVDRMKRFLNSECIHPSQEQLCSIVGSSARKRWELIDSWYPCPIEEDDFERRFSEYFTEEPINYKSIREETLISTLEVLVENKYALAIASSSSFDEVSRIIKECEVDRYFAVIASGDMFHDSKPNPEIYLFTAKKLNVRPEECLVIEDSPYGIVAAKRANMIVVAKRENRFMFSQNGADYFVDNLSEAIDILNQINQN